MIGSPLGTWTSKSVIWNSTTSHHKAISRWHCIGMVTTVLPFKCGKGDTFQILTGSISRKVQSYELEKIHSPWLRSRMRFRSRDCDGDGKTWWFHGRSTWWFHGRDGNARRRHGRHGNARRFHAADGNGRRRFHATFDGRHANAPRSDDEFTLGHATLWRPKLQSK